MEQNTPYVVGLAVARAGTPPPLARLPEEASVLQYRYHSSIGRRCLDADPDTITLHLAAVVRQSGDVLQGTTINFIHTKRT